MINTKHLIKVVSVWTSVVFIVCYFGVVVYPPIRELFMRYALHAEVSFNSNFLSIEYFFSGIVIWNITTILGAWLFAIVYNYNKNS